MFEKIIGNEKIKELLEKTIKNNTVSHSYMFIGTQGIGKKEIAKEFAKMILCLNEKKYCDECKSCIEFNSGNHPDFKIIEPEGNTLKIDQIREFQRKVSEKPVTSSKKVYIINDSDKMTRRSTKLFIKNTRRTTRICNNNLNRRKRKSIFKHNKIKMYDNTF